MRGRTLHTGHFKLHTAPAPAPSHVHSKRRFQEETRLTLNEIEEHIDDDNFNKNSNHAH